MNALKKLDAIPAPYSTALAIGIPALFGGYLMVTGEGGSGLGFGIILGAVFAIVVKKAAEVSDRAVLSWLLRSFR